MGVCKTALDRHTIYVSVFTYTFLHLHIYFLYIYVHIYTCISICTGGVHHMCICRFWPPFLFVFVHHYHPTIPREGLHRVAEFGRPPTARESEPLCPADGRVLPGAAMSKMCGGWLSYTIFL